MPRFDGQFRHNALAGEEGLKSTLQMQMTRRRSKVPFSEAAGIWPFPRGTGIVQK
jgi:hypothetical protein